jgi:hypothetical protein|nr:MAG TPA: Head Tail Connector Protein [Caudoviricetes sp.]
METVLQLLKMDLGISHTGRDTFFKALLESSQKEIEKKGFKLNLEDVEDQVLLSDYASWRYRKRTEDVPMARNLNLRIKDRIVQARGENYVG